MSALHRTYSHAPYAPTYMLQAFRRSPGWQSGRGCPDLRLKWERFRIEPAAVERLREICGLRGETGSGRVELLYPQVTGFRLIMAVLTHPSWPLPIWNALQVRNRLVLHRPLHPGEDYDLEVGASGWRELAKGLEIDLHLTLAREGDVRWESVVTFYYRGRYGTGAEAGEAMGAPAASPALGQPDDTATGEPDAKATPASTERRCETHGWNVGDGDRWAFARLTGDYNGLHQWNAYARRLGFPAAFPHPQRILGQCLARLPDLVQGPARLDLWIKGPVSFGREVTMSQGLAPDGTRCDFGLWLRGEPRPALIGTLSGLGSASSQLAA